MSPIFSSPTVTSCLEDGARKSVIVSNTTTRSRTGMHLTDLDTWSASFLSSRLATQDCGDYLSGRKSFLPVEHESGLSVLFLLGDASPKTTHPLYNFRPGGPSYIPAAPTSCFNRPFSPAALRGTPSRLPKRILDCPGVQLLFSSVPLARVSNAGGRIPAQEYRLRHKRPPSLVSLARVVPFHLYPRTRLVPRGSCASMLFPPARFASLRSQTKKYVTAYFSVRDRTSKYFPRTRLVSLFLGARTLGHLWFRSSRHGRTSWVDPGVSETGGRTLKAFRFP